MAIHILAIPHKEESAVRADTSLAVAYSGAVLGWFLSAGVYIAAKWAAAEMPPWTLCFWRLALACAILLPVVRGHYGDMATLLRHRALEVAMVAVLGLTACQGLIYTGLQYTDATTAGILMAICPIITMILAFLLLGERLGLWQALGACLAFAGVLVIVARGEFATLLGLRFNLGELWIIVGALCWGLYTVLLKRLKFELDRLPLLVLLLGFGALGALPLYLWEVFQDPRSTLDTKGLIALAYVAAPGGALMYYLYNWSVEVLGASRAGLLLYLQTAFVALLAYLLLGESLHRYDLAGAAFIIAGLVVAMALKPPDPVAKPSAG